MENFSNDKEIGWRKLEPPMKIEYKQTNIEEESLDIPKNINNTPYGFFSLFIDKEYLLKIEKNSNDYLKHKKSNSINDDSKVTNKINNKNSIKNSTRANRCSYIYLENIEKYIGVLILMNIHKLPEYKDHWNNDPLLSSPVKSIMSIYQYEIINEFIHPEDAKAKEEEKIIKSIIEIMGKSKNYFNPGTVLTIDERMISFRGRTKFIVYDSSKPTKWGYRPYVLSDKKTGYTISMKLLQNLEENEENKGKMQILCEEFMKDIYEKTKKQYILCTDGLYTTEDLLEEKNFFFIGAIRQNRIKSNRDNITKKIKKGEFEYFYKSCKKGNATLTKYNDSKQMYIISNFINLPKEVKRNRWCKDKKKFIIDTYPNSIKVYSEYMKGVDLSNQLISYYELNSKTYKWWKRIFFHLIDISIVNSYILYKKYNKSAITQKTFRLEIVKSIINKYKIEIDKERNNDFHFPVYCNERKTCKNCSLSKDYTTKKAPTTHYICSNCKCYLCINCFEKFHLNYYV